MAYDKKKDSGEPVLEFFWDSLELAVDKTYSTTIRVKLTGWWEGGKPREVAVSVYQRGEEPPSGNAVRIQKGFGSFPLTGLEPGHHYLVVVYIGDRLPVQKMIAVPEIPKPKNLEQEALEHERTELERAKVVRQLKQEKVEPPEPKRQLKILHIYKRLSRLEVVLQRIGKDGRPEDGEISVLDFEQAGVVFSDTTRDLSAQEKKWGVVVFFLPYFEYPRQVTFFLPDEPDADKPFVDVPVRAEKKPERVKGPSLFQRMREAYSEERDKVRTPVDAGNP